MFKFDGTARINGFFVDDTITKLMNRTGDVLQMVVQSLSEDDVAQDDLFQISATYEVVDSEVDLHVGITVPDGAADSLSSVWRNINDGCPTACKVRFVCAHDVPTSLLCGA